MEAQLQRTNKQVAYLVCQLQEFFADERPEARNQTAFRSRLLFNTATEVVPESVAGPSIALLDQFSIAYEESCFEAETHGNRCFRTEVAHYMPATDSATYTPIQASGRQVTPRDNIASLPKKYFSLRAEKEYKDIPPDTWGAAIITMVEEIPHIMRGTAETHNYLRASFSMMALFVNAAMQIFILYWVNKFVVNKSVRKIQNVYSAYHRESFDSNGTFSELKWALFDRRIDLCQATISEMFFISTILLLWMARMMGEVRDIRLLVRHIHQLPNLAENSSLEDMINVKEEGGDVIHEIVALTPWIRSTIHIFITAPKFLVCVWLLWMGCRWLASTDSFSDLIQNVMALDFIIRTDELFFDSFFPESMVESVELTKLAPPKPSIDEEENARIVRWMYIKSFPRRAYILIGADLLVLPAASHSWLQLGHLSK